MSEPALSRAFRAYLMLTVALCGALVMVVEVLGSRVIGPFFGVSLFVWTALITVTLLSLAAGYAIGGTLADRYPTPAPLYLLILLAGLLVGAIPLLKPTVVMLAQPLGLRAGALLSATLLFGPALLLLGCVSPWVVRIAVREWQSLGRTVGWLYALSTAGSFVGTAATGFYLIALFGVSQALLLTGAALCLLGAGYFALFRARPLWLAVLIPFVFAPRPALPSVTMADGTRVRLVEAVDSFYGSVRITEYAGAGIQTREMVIDGLVQGGIDTADGASIYEYTYLMRWLPRRVKADLSRVLAVGLGPGVVAADYARDGAAVRVFEIDPVVTAMARKYFALPAAAAVVEGDARYLLAQAAPAVDVVLMDAFSGDAMPAHLLSREALQAVKARLTPDGLLVLNVFVSIDPSSRLTQAIVRTVQAEFSDVALFPLFDDRDTQAPGGNLVIVARNGRLDRVFGDALDGPVHRLAEAGVRDALRRGRLAGTAGAGLVLTDDYNPLDLLDVDLHERVRKTILDTTPPAILLHG